MIDETSPQEPIDKERLLVELSTLFVAGSFRFQFKPAELVSVLALVQVGLKCTPKSSLVHKIGSDFLKRTVHDFFRNFPEIQKAIFEGTLDDYRPGN